VNTSEFHELSLGYAVHVYKAQGLTTERASVLTGGWQTDRESTYVALSRARDQTDIYLSREDLGQDGPDPEAIGRLAQLMQQSHAQQATITREPAQATAERSPDLRQQIHPIPDRQPDTEHVLDEPLQAHQPETQQDRDRDTDLGLGID
jgi:hypothetical protein